MISSQEEKSEKQGGPQKFQSALKEKGEKSDKIRPSKT